MSRHGRIPREAFAGKIVLLGASFLGNADSNAAPFGSTQMPGTERMANIIDTILTRDFITEITPPQLGPIVLAVVLLASLSGLTMAHMPTRIAFLAGLGPIAVWACVAQWAFLHDVWLPFVGPGAALVAAAISVIMFRYWIVDREGRYVRSAFRHYLSPDMVNMLAEKPHLLKLGGETRPMTMLFCDVRGFTAISETFKTNPQGLTQLINRFLTPLTDIIMSRNGTIDKYMGDCIMAFWNAPLDDPHHADHALRERARDDARARRRQRRARGRGGRRRAIRSISSRSASASTAANASSATWARTSASIIPCWAMR